MKLKILKNKFDNNNKKKYYFYDHYDRFRGIFVNEYQIRLKSVLLGGTNKKI